MEKKEYKFNFEVFKEKKDKNGNWCYVIGTTEDYRTQYGAEAYATGLKFLLKPDERFRIMDKNTGETIKIVGGNNEKL